MFKWNQGPSDTGHFKSMTFNSNERGIKKLTQADSIYKPEKVINNKNLF